MSSFQSGIQFYTKFEELSQEQQQAARRVIDGNLNVFITGSAGTGKSFLLRYIIQELRLKYSHAAVAVTAPTGVAAVNIGGSTVHSFAGIGIGPFDPLLHVAGLAKKKKVKEKMQALKVLIVDEISMLDVSLFDHLDLMLRQLRADKRPFGGVQLIVVGDFLQLPPVRRPTPARHDVVSTAVGADGSLVATVVKTPAGAPFASSPERRELFCFESAVWQTAGLRGDAGVINLQEVVRQSDDQFIELLNDIRVGNRTSPRLPLLDGCAIALKPLPTDGIVPTKLYCMNKDVDAENARHLAAIEEDAVEVRADDSWTLPPFLATAKTRLLEQADKVAPPVVTLKRGAQVVLLRNRANDVVLFNRLQEQAQEGQSSEALATLLSRKPLVNGSRGRVVGFERSAVSGDTIPKVRFDDGQVLAIGKVDFDVQSPEGDAALVRRQVPLKLAW